MQFQSKQTGDSFYLFVCFNANMCLSRKRILFEKYLLGLGMQLSVRALAKHTMVLIPIIKNVFTEILLHSSSIKDNKNKFKNKILLQIFIYSLTDRTKSELRGQRFGMLKSHRVRCYFDLHTKTLYIYPSFNVFRSCHLNYLGY